MTAFFQKLGTFFSFLFGQVNNTGKGFQGSGQVRTKLQYRTPSNRAGQCRSQTPPLPKQQRYQTTHPPKSGQTDLVGLVGFHDRGFLVAKPAEPHAHWLQERVASLPGRVSGMSTNITDGLRKGLELFENVPKTRLRRIWLLTDGKPNRENDRLMAVVAEARRLHVNVNTIGFGDPGSALYDPNLLKEISKATHNGRFIAVDSLRALSNALKKGSKRGICSRRPETTVLVIDCSGSMIQSMENKRRIDVVVEAITHLLHYKQKCFT